MASRGIPLASALQNCPTFDEACDTEQARRIMLHAMEHRLAKKMVPVLALEFWRISPPKQIVGATPDTPASAVAS